MIVISCRAVTRSYGTPGATTLTAVDAVDLDVEAGTFTAIEGPSGSGKSTLLCLLAGLEAPDRGQITVLGHDLWRLTATERARLRQRRIGIVFQSFGLLPSLTAAENVALPLAFAGTPEHERRRHAESALDEVGLGTSVGARIDELSGGERQRVGIARALVIEPAVILADEPTGSLDVQNGDNVLGLLIGAVRRRGASLVLVTHDPVSAARADRRYAMFDGRLRAAAATAAAGDARLAGAAGPA